MSVTPCVFRATVLWRWSVINEPRSESREIMVTATSFADAEAKVRAYLSKEYLSNHPEQPDARGELVNLYRSPLAMIS